MARHSPGSGPRGRNGARGGRHPADPIERLTGRERRVCREVALGRTNRETAQRLCLTETTVRNYLSRAFEKLQVSRRAELAALFARQDRRG